MLHLGDITKINGAKAPVVDCVIGGSPCQDLSVAGKRAGLAGERSGLFMEQIRIIKEMREADVLRGRTDDNVRPRYMVWENVPGAFSSNGGKDFAAVLEEAIRVAEPEAPPVSVPEKGWPTSGCFMGDKWSVAWRVLDAQFWGVPQRRRRIALIADFGGKSAPEILFVRKSVSGNLEQSRPPRKETAGTSGESSDEPVPCTIKIRGGCAGGAFTLGARDFKGVQCVCLTYTQPHFGEYKQDDISNTLRSSGADCGGGSEVIVMSYQKVTGPLMANSHPGSYCGQDAYSDMLITGEEYDGNNLHGDRTGKCGDYAGGCPTLNASHEQPIVMGSHKQHSGISEDGTCTTLTAQEKERPVITASVVRRLTPLECERLQGFPDGWTDIGEWIDSRGKKHKEADSPRYKALGNSIAIPPWKWVLKRLCACYERDATMASLFDGIGGFPLIWEQINGEGSCLWASEIEEFPMAVTKVRFGE